MKRFVFTLMIGIAALALYACEDALTDAESTPQLSVAGEQTAPSGGFLFPEGTDVGIHEDESGKRFIRFELPESHRLIGRVDPSFPGLGGQVMRTPGGDITCTCTGGSGDCEPFCAGSGDERTCGCRIDPDCSQCLIEQSRMMQTDQGLVRVPFEEAVIANLGVGIRFVVNEADLASLSCPTSALFEDPEILAELQEYVGYHQRHNVEEARAARTREELPDNYVMAPVNVYGNLVWVPVEKGTSLAVSLGRVVRGEAKTPGGGGTCSCSSGGGSCQHFRESIPLIGWAEWCESRGCSSCTLHI